MRKLIPIALLAMTLPASAQQQSNAPDRIALQIGRLVIQAENQQDMIASLQQQLLAAQDRIKALEAKQPPEK